MDEFFYGYEELHNLRIRVIVLFLFSQLRGTCRLVCSGLYRPFGVALGLGYC